MSGHWLVKQTESESAVSVGLYSASGWVGGYCYALALLIAERGYWIDLGGAASRDVAGDQGGQ